MGGGSHVDRSAWPDSGPKRQLLEFLERVRGDNGLKSLREIARGMNLASPNRVGKLLRGVAEPVDQAQLDRLVWALGGGDDEGYRARKLYVKARATGSPPQRRRTAVWHRARSGYVDQVRSIAPTGGLLGRESELAEMAAFCAGNESYLWWQAGPWAGKSALLSTFVLDPPSGVEVVAFFIMARLAVQADSTAFTEALLDQLSPIVGEALPSTPSAHARDAHRRRLLTEATACLQRTNQRLVLVIDGLDEDLSSTAGSGLASIASLLPTMPPTGLKIIRAGRPDPPIPEDVAPDHPVRTCRIRWLDVSPHATEIGRLARQELSTLLSGDQLHRDVLGLITASGGGLTLGDLQELTGNAAYELESLFGGLLGRTLISQLDLDSRNPQRVFVFAHDTLREEAINRFGIDLDRYRGRIHDWSRTYQQGGWPAKTPEYLLRAYPQMLHRPRARTDQPRRKTYPVTFFGWFSACIVYWRPRTFGEILVPLGQRATCWWGRGARRPSRDS